MSGVELSTWAVRRLKTNVWVGIWRRPDFMPGEVWRDCVECGGGRNVIVRVEIHWYSRTVYVPYATALMGFEGYEMLDRPTTASAT